MNYDDFTSTVDGAAGYERMRSKNDPKDYSGYDPRDEFDFDEEDMNPEDERECNCSDPGCPCSGFKIGSV